MVSLMLKGTSNNSWTASKRFKKPASALKTLQIDMLFAAIFALNSIFLIHLATRPELIDIPLILYNVTVKR